MVSKVEKVVEIPQVQYVDKVVPIPVQKQARTASPGRCCAVCWVPLASLGHGMAGEHPYDYPN